MKLKPMYIAVALIVFSAMLVIAGLPKNPEPTPGKSNLGRGKHLIGGGSARGASTLNSSNRRRIGSAHPEQNSPTPTPTPTPPLGASPAQGTTVRA